MYHRTGAGYLSWQFVIVAATSMAAVIFPFNLVLHIKEDDAYRFLNGAITVIFLVDILFSMRQAQAAPDFYHAKDEGGVRRYLRSWFVVDLLAFIPFGLLFAVPGVQLLRLLKLAKVLHYMQNWRQHSLRYTNTLSLLFFVYWIAVAAHWIGCGWLALRGIEPSHSMADNYIAAVYWTVSTLTTVGYGDITPITSGQRLYAMGVQLLGIGVYGFIIGNIASILSKRDPTKARYLESLEKLGALLHYRRLPVDLQNRIRDYYAYMWRQRKGYEESEFLRGLPRSLQVEVAMHLKQEVIENIPLFHGAERRFIADIAGHLRSLVLIPGDRLFSEGDEGHEMYFVVNGRLAVLKGADEERLSELGAGDFFGEIALFSNKPRTATVRALSYCDLYSLDRSAFDRVVARYSDILAQIEARATAREAHNGEVASQPVVS